MQTTPQNVYDAFDRVTKGLSAYCLIKEGNVLGRVVIKYGNMRTHAYVQVCGHPMVKGISGGCGYDVSSAAVENAVHKLAPEALQELGGPVKDDNGNRWSDVLHSRGINCQHVLG